MATQNSYLQLASVLTPLSTVSYWFSLSTGYPLIFKCAVVYTVWDSEELPLNKRALKKKKKICSINQKVLLTSTLLHKWGQAPHLLYTPWCPRLVCLRWFYGLLTRRTVFKDLSDTSSLRPQENISKGMEDSFWMGPLLGSMMCS